MGVRHNMPIRPHRARGGRLRNLHGHCDMDPDDLMMIALDAGAEDFADEEDCYEITTAPEDFSDVRENLEKEGIARDFVRMIQALRKTKDFDISDRIKLAYSSDNATVKNAISEYSDYIKEQVLALEIAENNDILEPTVDELGGDKVKFDVTKAA